MEIKLDSEAAASIASAAIFESLSQDQRENVLKQAVQHLLTPEKETRPGYFGNGKTPLQKAFEQALSQAAYRAVEEHVKNDPKINEMIVNMLQPLIMPALEEEASQHNYLLSNKLGAAIADWLAEVARERMS